MEIYIYIYILHQYESGSDFSVGVSSTSGEVQKPTSQRKKAVGNLVSLGVSYILDDAIM